MVHVRLNERVANPNPQINFITPLPNSSPEALDLLRALAAQVKPIMKSHGFLVNSFEEYEHNEVFVGRNWNEGETVELVLRRPDGSFYPMWTLLDVLCHELAHIKYMNHFPAFQKLWAQLRNEVKALRARGYYGDGLWSAGTRLGDGLVVDPQGLDNRFLPKYVCGGAQRRTQSKTLDRHRRRRRRPGSVKTTDHTGAQAQKKRKTGSLVTSKALFQGRGQSLESPLSSICVNAGVVGPGFRRKANSQQARLARAEMADRRLRALEASNRALNEQEDGSEDDFEDEIIPETNADRQRYMMEMVSPEELEGLKCYLPAGDDHMVAESKADAVLRMDTGPSTKNSTKRGDTSHLVKDTPADKGLAILSSRDNPTQWACSLCTFLNPEMHLMCSMCSTVRHQ